MDKEWTSGAYWGGRGVLPLFRPSLGVGWGICIVFVCVCSYVCVCVYIYVCVCVCVIADTSFLTPPRKECGDKQPVQNRSNFCLFLSVSS